MTVTGEGGHIPPSEQLRSNALGLWQLVILGVAYMGLALTVYFNVGIMEGITGPIVPLAFAAVTIAMLPTAASFAVMNSRRPSTGSVFTWLWEATWPPLGIWLGWVLVVTYIVGSILQPVMFGLFFNSLLDYFGIGAGTWTAIISGLGAVAVVAVLTKKDIRLSAKVTGYFIAIEAGFVALLALYIIIKQAIDGNFTLDPFVYSNNTAGWTGFQNATLLAILAIAAFDIVAPMAEETRTPRSLVPKATIYVTIGAGLYWVFTSFGFVISVPPDTMASYVSSGEFTPIYLVADNYIHVLRILVPLTGITAVFAAFTAISITAARLLYALSREGLAPKVFAQTDENKTPWNAQALVLACCIVLPLIIVVWQDGKLAERVRMDRRVIRVLRADPVHACLRGEHLLPPADRPGSVQRVLEPDPAADRHRHQRLRLLQELPEDVLPRLDRLHDPEQHLLVRRESCSPPGRVFTAIGVMRTGGAKEPHHFSEVAEEIGT